uniref:Uncharacterized protein n=1 Tax=Fundulus heteroclitus TaxID=8078 RepID=A0A3Q2QKP8_FUNHE
MVSSKHGDSAIEELSSSSSSDSDADSDYECNREDKRLEVETMARTYSSVLYSPSHQEKGQDEELIVNGVTKGITIAETEATQFIVEASKDISQDSGSKILTATRGTADLAISKFSIDAAPVITQQFAQYEPPALVVTQNEFPEKAQSNDLVKRVDGFTAPADGLGDAAEESWEKATIGPVESETAFATVAGNPPAEGGRIQLDSVEELVDSAQVVIEATGEELHAETSAAQPEESTAAPPVTEEPFDNSKYKNYQHHSYTNYTFADLDVEMAKHRLPQPSSGKSSPRH